MSFKVEDLGKNMVKLTIEVAADEFEKAMETAYQKNKNKLTVQGFRKGKAPRSIVEKIYGPGVFYEDAANEVMPEAYEKAADESGLDIVSKPEIDIVQIEKGKEFIFTAEVAVKPEVTLGEYKGVSIDKIEVSVSDEEIDAELNRVREQNARIFTVEDRPVADGDEAMIDFEGFVDDAPFAGGKGEDYKLVIGSHSFIDTFEEQLIGKNVGEEVEVNVTFPEDYHAKELAGRPAKFKVHIKGIMAKELPALDDEFAVDVSEFDTLAEYKEDIKKNLLEKKEKEAKYAKEDAVVDKIIEGAAMEIPDAMVDSQTRQMAEEYAQRLQMQGLSLEQYFKFTGMNANSFMENLKPQALKRIQCRLVLEAVAKSENIEVSDEELDKEYETMAQNYRMEKEKLVELVSEKEKEQIKMDIAVQKAVDIVRDAAKEK
ncbi:MAG: trigger factor [Lachnospiraceae bacterium]|nr:trigger factor [Lachnospiraceae bacterium]